METPQVSSVRPAGIRELPIVAGHLALDFANTVDDPLGPERFDHVIDYPGLLAWAVRRSLLTDITKLQRTAAAHPDGAAAAVDRGKQLRDALNAAFGAITDGIGPQDTWPRLRPFVATAIQQASLNPHPTWEFAELDAPLWPIAESAYALLTGPDLTRLKRCVGCPWLFLDRSRNGSRRWCSMELCGTEQKIHRYLTKRATHRTP